MTVGEQRTIDQILQNPCVHGVNLLQAHCRQRLAAERGALQDRLRAALSEACEMLRRAGGCLAIAGEAELADSCARHAERLRPADETSAIAACVWVEVTIGQYRPGCGVERFTTTWRDPLVKFCEYCGKPLQWPTRSES